MLVRLLVHEKAFTNGTVTLPVANILIWYLLPAPNVLEGNPHQA